MKCKEWNHGDNKFSFHFGDDKKNIHFLLKEKPTKTKPIIWRLLSRIAQYCKLSQMLILIE